MSGRLHAQAVLSPGKAPPPPVQTGTRLCGPHSRSGRFGDETNVLSEPAIEPRFLGRKIHVIVTIPTELSWFREDECFKGLPCATCNLRPAPTFRPLVLGIVTFLHLIFRIVLAEATTEPPNNPSKSETLALFAGATVDGKAACVTNVRGTLVASTVRARSLGTASVMKDGEACFATRI